MINIAFVGPQREIIRFIIEDKKVTYFDKNWKQGIQIYPLDKELILKMKRGSQTIRIMAAFILDANKGKDFEEYKSCKTEEDIANLVKKDALGKGMIEIK